MNAKIKRVVISAIPIIAFFALWEFGARFAPKGSLKPPTSVIPATLSALFSKKERLGYQTLVSMGRIGAGFGLAAAVGNTLGFLLGTYFKRLERWLLPFFRVCEKLNPFALIPIFMIFFGIDTKEKVALVFWVCLWPILTTTQEAAKSVDVSLVRAARSMGANRFKVFRSVIFPFVLPSVFTGLKLGARVAFFMIVAAETYGSSSGLGWYYMRKNALYNLNLLYGSVLYITLLAILLNYVFTRLEKRFLTWKTAAFR
ncbi:MAG: ABC transporter permease [Oscillospiraceae bacterium]|jgi:NitT/TauT family transport system permease protein|nr:ABC transporter permease [Oscillospiraceae bacterium]